MACCNKRVNQSHMKILSIILALFATSFAVHAQTYTKAELTQAAYNIQQGHNEGAKICLTYKAQVEASKAWTEEIRRNYLFAIQSLLEYYSMQKRYTDEEELLNHAIALYNTRDSITNNPQTRALHTMQTRVQFDKKNYDALIGYAKKALNMYNAVGDHGIDYCILCCNTSLAYVEQDDEQHATQYIDEAFNCQQKLSAQFNLSKYRGYYPIQNQRGYVYLIFGMYEKAIECFKDIVDNASPDTLASVYYLAANNLSTCYFIMNQLDKAIPLLETVKKATPTLAYTVSQNLSVDYALTGNDKKALENLRQFNAEGYEQALAIISKFSEIDREAMLKKLSQEMSDCNNFVVRYVPQAAVEAFDINLLMRSASLSVNRMVKDFANKSCKYNELAHLRQMLAKGHISTAQYDSIHHAIIDIEQNLLRADNQFELTLKAQTATYESTKQMLKADEAYVLYCNLPTFDVEDGELAKTLHYAAYIVRSQQNDGPTMVDLGVLENIDSLFFTATPTAEYAAETYAAGNAQLLYDKLWAPLMPHLKGAKRVYYSTTGNGLARHLHIPLQPRKAIEVINRCVIHRLDYGTINERPFFCTCGVGFDAFISERFASAGKRGLLTYVENTLKSGLLYKPQVYTIEDADGAETCKAFLIACANASQYGNDAYIAPYASMRDGLLDVVVMEPFNTIESAQVAFQLFTGTLPDNSHVKTFRSSHLRITREGSGVAHYDGDPFVTGSSIDVCLHREGLPVVVNPDKPDGQNLRQPVVKNLMQHIPAFFSEWKRMPESIIEKTSRDLLKSGKNIMDLFKGKN